jgi:hypothetical protein
MMMCAEKISRVNVKGKREKKKLGRARYDNPPVAQGLRTWTPLMSF